MARLDTAEVAKALGIAPDTLLAYRRQAPPHLRAPALVLGVRRASYRWKSIEAVEAWLEELSTWRASSKNAKSGGLPGGISLGSSAGGAAPTKGRRSSYSETSSSKLPSEGTGNLRSLAKSLASGKLQPTGSEHRIARSPKMEKIWETVTAPPRAAIYLGHPYHAFRKGFMSGLLELGAKDTAVEYLVGHVMPGVQASYVDPRSLQLKEAIRLVPPIKIG